MSGYSAFVLTDKSRNMLLAAHPPKFSKVIAHHITHEFGIDVSKTPMKPKCVKVVGYAFDDSLDAVVVKVDGGTDRPDGKIYHVTMSLEPYRKPKEANELVCNPDKIYLIENGLVLDVEPEFVRF
jgi:hypothetical protein